MSGEDNSEPMLALVERGAPSVAGGVIDDGRRAPAFANDAAQFADVSTPVASPLRCKR